jgi:F-type H+-transporting ATPase subunit delta
MSEQKVAGRYAKALLDLSREQNSLEAVLKNMHEFLDVLSKNPQLAVVLKSPVVGNEHKIIVLEKIFAKAFQPNVIKFMGIIVHKNRSFLLRDIAENFIDQYNELHNIIKASVKTAYQLDASTLNEVKSFIEKYSGKQVYLHAAVDHKLIGGLEIVMGDKLFDASIAGKLNKIKQQLLNTYISK